MISTHEQMVQDFLREAEENDPQHFKDVCKRNPVLSGRQWRRIREREVRLTPQIASEFGIDSDYRDEDEG
jgi:hypothetical protein